MTVLNFCGFDTGVSAETYSPSGTFSIQNSITHSPGYALRTNPTTSGTGWASVAGFSSNGNQNNSFGTNDMYARFYFRVATLPASGAEEIYNDWSSSPAFFSIRITSLGKLDGYDSTTTKVATGTTALSTNTWYRLEVHTQAGVSGAYELKINGVSEWASTCNQTVNPKSIASFGKRVDRSSQSVDFYYDDVCILDNAYPGAGQCTILKPSANGTYQAWTVGAGVGSHYQLVNEIPPDGDTSYLLSGASTTVETEQTQTRAAAGLSMSTLTGVKGGIYINRDGGSAPTTFTRVRSVSTDTDTGTGFNVGVSYNFQWLLLTTNPATSAAWLPAGLDTLEVGCRSSTSTAVRMSGAYIFIDYVPSAGGLYRSGCDLNGLGGAGGKFFTNPLG